MKQLSDINPVRFKKWDCNIVLESYQNNGRTAIVLENANEDESANVAVATVNIPSATLAEDHVLIKNWSENEGILEFLEEKGVLQRTGKTVPTGFVQAHEAKLLINQSKNK